MCKRISMFSIIIILAFYCLTATDARGDFICGDANGDSDVNVSDAVYIINYVFVGGDPPNPIECGDCNCDLTVNVSDAVWIINYVFVGGNEPCDLNGDGIPNCDPGCSSTMTDIDGNVYHTVLIDDQCWMMENLKVTHYRNGDPIPNVTEAAEWICLSTGAYCDYNNDTANVSTYARLYNWYAVDDNRGIAPEGWHVPSDAELKQLEMYLGLSQAEVDATGWRGTDEGGKLKEADTMHWRSPNTGATNESGFSALPGGYRYTTGSFYSIGSYAAFWSSTEVSSYAWLRFLIFSDSQVFRHYHSKGYGFSVRCVRD